MTTITITKKTKEKISKFAKFGESWDEFLSRVADLLADKENTRTIGM